MLRKALTLVTLSVFVTQVLLADLVAQEKIKPPTFEKIYQDYSFRETADLSGFVTYDVKEIEKEQKRLAGKEKTETEAARKEQFLAKRQFREYQNQLKTVSDELEKIGRKYRSEETVIQDGKPRKVPKIDYDGLQKDPDYQTLQEKRKELECKVKEMEVRSNEDLHKAKLEHIKIFYEVLHTQLDLLRDWPAQLAQIRVEIDSGKSDQRLFANPENIGLRDLGFGNQGEDTKIWQDPEAKRFLEDLRDKEYKHPEVKAYVVSLVLAIAVNTDLKIPVEDQNILISPEDDINAFALPGGIININRGLLLKANTEAELAGVIAHELAHVAARHSYRLFKKVRMAGIIFQAAQIAAMIFTGGIATLLGYYALQGLFSGLGMLINLKLLGVSREFELEADTLGMQYVWRAGYDPDSFMNFFEKMGKDKGNVRKTSFFRTHPAFAKRFTNAFREENFLTPKEKYISNTTAFMEMKARLCVAIEAEKAEEKELQRRQRPTLTRKEQKEEERLKKDCGLQKPTDNRPSPCDDPQLEGHKQKIREELAKDEGQSKEEKNRPSLKRPPPPNN